MHDIQSVRHWRKINPDRVISLGSPCQGLLFSVCDTESYLFVMWLNRTKRYSQNFTHDWAESMWPHSHLWPGSTTTASFWGISTLTLTDCIWTSLIIWPKQSFVVTDIPVPKGCREVPQYQWPLTFRTSHGVWFNPVTGLCIRWQQLVALMRKQLITHHWCFDLFVHHLKRRHKGKKAVFGMAYYIRFGGRGSSMHFILYIWSN